MGYVFDGVNRVIQLTGVQEELDVKDLYSRWKDWVWSGEGAKFYEAFRVVGGDPIDEKRGVYITSYFYLVNGWRIRPYPANHRIRVVNGVLLTETGESPFVYTTEEANVIVEYSQPVRTETIVIETGVSGLTPEESEALLMIKDKVEKVDSIKAVVDESFAKLLLLLGFVKNKKYLEKRDGKWYLVVRDETDSKDILRKELKDVEGKPIEDVPRGVVAIEEKSEV